MKTTWIMLTAVAIACAGCATHPRTAGDSSAWIGSEVRFTTSEPAPEDIDAFTFFWMSPVLERFDTQVYRIITLANGNEHVVDDDVFWPNGGSIRSDVSPEDAPNTPEQFRGKNITMIFRSKNGRLRLPRDCCSFAFYRKGKDGTINWRQPDKQVDAVAEWSTAEPEN